MRRQPWARYYDPKTGRWISQDPLGFDAGDSNLYRYVENRTTGETDPSGLEVYSASQADANTLQESLAGSGIQTTVVQAKGNYFLLPTDMAQVRQARSDPRWANDSWTTNVLNALGSSVIHREVYQRDNEFYSSQVQRENRTAIARDGGVARNNLAFMSGLEIGSLNPNLPFNALIGATTNLSQEEVMAYVRGFYIGKWQAQPEQALLRQTMAARLEGQAIRMENARILGWGNFLSYLTGYTHHPMTEQEVAVRTERAQWLNPYYELQNGRLTPSAGGMAALYARNGVGYDADHGLLAPSGIDDPAFWAALIITKGMSAGGLGSLMTRQTARAAIVNGLSGGVIDVGDQILGMMEGGKSFEVSRVLQASVSGAFIFPMISGAPSLSMPLMAVGGMIAVTDAADQGMPLTGAYRATIALFGMRTARRLIRQNAAPRTVIRSSPANLNHTNTLGELMPGVHPDAMVHISPEAPQAFLADGVLAGNNNWVRFGDVSHLTPQQYRTNVVGVAAPGHSPRATTMAVVQPRQNMNQLFRPDHLQANIANVIEFDGLQNIHPDTIFQLPAQPAP